MIASEMIKKGKVLTRGPGSRTIPFSADMSELFEGGVKIGDDYEWHRDGDRLYILFPGKPMIPSKAGKGKTAEADEKPVF
jgi:hypothetical protein